MLAYKDDVTIFVTSLENIPIIRDAIWCYETASGVHPNITKSKGMAVVTWNTTINIMDVRYYTDVKVLGFSVASTVNQSAHNSRSRVTGRVQTQTREAYCRDLCLSRRILHVHAYPKESYMCMLSWYTAQVFPAPEECVRQLNSAISWYIWQGATFWFPSRHYIRGRNTVDGV